MTRTWFITCGSSDLRLVDLNPQKVDWIFKGCLSAAAVGAGSILFAQSPDTAMFDDNPQPGLWLFISSGNGGTQMRVSDADIREIAWEEGSGTFLARASDNRLYEVLPTVQIRVLAENQPMIPAVSPDGRFWAYSDASHFDSPSGVWIGEYGQALRQIFADKISPNQILFMPPGNSLLFLDADGNLYRANAPDWEPILLAAGLRPASSDLSLAFVPNDNWVF